jgi:hypothetical protein
MPPGREVLVVKENSRVWLAELNFLPLSFADLGIAHKVSSTL